MRKAGARFKSKKGISLVELVITIALLSIFACLLYTSPSPRD